ncbi:MAG: cupredoxin domain-containing protein [Actinomycetota bacterium]|nr:cupredoxin domain-containing protein [Actinomycetota bacterium]
MSEFRKRIVDPITPLLVIVVFIGVLVFSVSRILLAVPKSGSVIVALLLAVDVMFVAAIFAAARRVKAVQRGLLILLGLGLVGGGIASGATFGVRPVEEHATGLPVTVKNIKFDAKTITLPAGRENSILFVNDDAGTPHNFAISTDKEHTKPLFDPEPFLTGVAKTTYKVPALQAGAYYFFCAVHPTLMFGTLTVAQGATAGTS